jgi:uncharacterized protein YcbX
MSTSQRIGSIVSLWRYPVKSMMGEELNASDVTVSGLLGDRACALIDSSDGRVASAKNPVKWGKLFDCRAAFDQPPHKDEALPFVKITLPDGRIVSNAESDIDEVLSGLFGRSVRLMTAAAEPPVLEEYWPNVEGLAHKETVTDESIAMDSPAGTFFDYAVIHVLTTNSIDRLRQLYPSGRFEARRFRPNIIIKVDGDQTGFVENQWIGSKLALGNGVILQITDPCARCVMTTLPQGDLPQDSGILRTAAQHNNVIGGKAMGADGKYSAAVGVYASVVKTGSVRRGDAVTLQ